MPKNKISEYSSNPANNTDIGSIDIAEGCAPSGINNAIRELMAQLKDQQVGSDADNFTVGGNLSVTGTSTLSGNTTLSSTLTANGSVGTAGQALVSRGAGLSPEWGSGFPSGGIIIWSGSTGAIPSGWFLCDGSNSTPDLRSRFVVGAGSTYAVGATGGSANATLVSHSHSATSSVSDPGHNHGLGGAGSGSLPFAGTQVQTADKFTTTSVTGISVSTSISTEGSSGTNANLPPYYALAYIMKA